jgi:hypothetical protein
MEQDNRQYKRLEREIVFLVEGKDRNGLDFLEKTTALNLSGGGAMFVTTCSENYYQDQVVNIKIVLPETPDVKGMMSSTAKVVRLCKSTEDDALSYCNNYRVAICFLKHLELIRLNR